MTQLDIKDEALWGEDVVPNKNISLETLDEVKFISERGVNLLPLIILPWKKKEELCKLSRHMF